MSTTKRKGKSKGLGDTIEKVTKATGMARTVGVTRERKS